MNWCVRAMLQEEMTSSDISSSCLIHTCEHIYFPRKMMFTELSLGRSPSGHSNLSMYQVSSSTVFFTCTYMSPLSCIAQSCLLLVFQLRNELFTSMFVRSQSFISLPSFKFVSALVSQLCKSKQNKETNAGPSLHTQYYRTV